MNVFGDIIRLNAKRYPDKKAIIMGDKYFTFNQLDRLSNQLAYGLLSINVKPGDRVGLLAYNCLEYIIINFAVAKCGAILVPINFRFKESELTHVINNSQPKVLFLGPQFLSLVENTKSQFSTQPQLIPIEGKPLESGHNLSTLMDSRSTSDPAIEVDPSSAASIIYTAGTTGFPKGVLASHSSFLSTNTGLIVEGDICHNDIILVALPLFHAGGLHMLVQPPLEMGATVILMGKGFDPEAFLDAIERYRISLTMCVPTQLGMMANLSNVGKYDLSSLTKMWYGSSAISPSVLEASRRIFQAGFYQWYGQTEAGIVMVLRPEDHVEHAHCTGREVFHADVRVVDENGNNTTVGEVGEIVGSYKPLGMMGYYGNEEATRKIKRDGWIHTEDLARVEGDGYYTIVDRLRDMIVSGGENIYSKEIEDVIVTHPAVKEVAVFGIPDEIYGESVCAVVVKQDEFDLTQQEIIDFCASRISSYKKPKRVDFTDKLPKNPTGKITKNVLREPYWVSRKRRV
jgi:acyl-CoA synthetase (AMP-forming)/AMP-acid ligase II